MQQANANRETLDRVTEILEHHATGLLTLEQWLEGIADIVADTAQQQSANAQQIAHNAEAITVFSGRSAQFDIKLEETRQLVAKNSSDIAQMNTETKASIDRLVEENRAFRELQQSQLAAIIGNARRLDRLDQQAG